MTNEATRIDYEVKDANGRLFATHRRIEEPGQDKTFRWVRPDGTMKLPEGKQTADAPLYGSEMVADLGQDEAIVLVEGAGTRDDLEAVGIPALGTVTGASGTPSAASLEVCRNREIILAPDNDDVGRDHMRRIGDLLRGIAAEVRWYERRDLPEKADLADLPTVVNRDRREADKLHSNLLSAPAYIGKGRESKGLSGRVRLGERIKAGVEPPEQLVEGFLYRGRMHALNGEPGAGKTTLALWSSLKVVSKGGTVLYLDQENGPNLIGERLDEMGADPEALDSGFHYFPSPDLSLEKDSLAALVETVEDLRPDLVVFDSLPDFLAVAGLSENDAKDVTTWMLKVAQPLKDAGCSVLMLDHLTKSQEGQGRYARGSGAKLAKMDVSWSLKQEKPFSRDRMGEVKISLQKDREAWFERRVFFAIGGKDDRLIVRRDSGIVETDDPTSGLNDSDRRVLDEVRDEGESGATWKMLMRNTPKGTLSRVLKKLANLDLITKENGRYFPVVEDKVVPTPVEPIVEPPMEPTGTTGTETPMEPEFPVYTPDPDGSTEFHSGSTKLNGTDATDGVPLVPPPFRGMDRGTSSVEPAKDDELTARIAAARRDGR